MGQESPAFFLQGLAVQPATRLQEWGYPNPLSVGIQVFLIHVRHPQVLRSQCQTYVLRIALLNARHVASTP